jgi:hypothetical protein
MRLRSAAPAGIDAASTAAKPTTRLEERLRPVIVPGPMNSRLGTNQYQNSPVRMCSLLEHQRRWLSSSRPLAAGTN